MSTSDGEIISRSISQRAAFTEVYDRHQRVIYRYVSRRIGPAHADDVTSETFLVAFARRDAFEGDDARPWLLGIATVLMRKFARQEARAWRGMLASDLGRISSDEIGAADTRLDAERIAPRLGSGLARLSPGDRDVLLLHVFGDLDYQGIADALTIPVGTVRSRLNRARVKLRASLKPYLTSDKESDHGRDFAAAAITD